MKEEKRKIELLVLSDIHLGTRGSHAKELLKYLKSVKMQTLILNGDIIDIWQFSKRYWPKSHMKVVKYIIGLTAKGVKVYYITGNHDETLRKFAGLKMGKLEIVNNLTLELGGKKTWFFHGDVFDVIMKNSKWLAKLGAVGYDSLIRLNTLVNAITNLLHYKKISLSKRIKDNVKTAVKHINNFEETAAALAIRKGYDSIVCGHIHAPEIREIKDVKGDGIQYLNSGDWIENLTALEYNKGTWNLYFYNHDFNMREDFNEQKLQESEPDEMDSKEIFNLLIKEFQN